MPLTIVATDTTYHADPEVAWVMDAINDWRERSERPRRDPGRFHASSLGSSDEDLIAMFNGTYVHRDLGAQKLRVFDNGHGVHARWGKYFRKAGLTIKHRKQFWIPRLRVKGTCDEIISNPETGQAVVVELKSIKPVGYSGNTSYPGFSQLVAPIESHVDQIHCYMAGLRIPNGIVLYESKGDQAVKVFNVPFDAARWRRIEERLIRLRKEAEAIHVVDVERVGPEVAEASDALIAAIEEAEGVTLAPTDIRRAAAVTKAKYMV